MSVKVKRIFFAVLFCILVSTGVNAVHIGIFINGNEVINDVYPVIEENRTLVPVRGIFEYMNAIVEWDSGIVRIYSENSEIIMTIGERKFYFNGNIKYLDVPAKIINNRTFIPLRAVSELLGCRVMWDDKERKVEILREAVHDAKEYLFEYEVFVLVNEIRAECGMSGFEWDELLAETGRMHAEDMYINDYFSHESQDGRTPFDRMIKNGVVYRIAAENIARDFEGAGSVVDSWMNSEAHRANILNPELTRLGVGYCNGYWCQEFAG